MNFISHYIQAIFKLAFFLAILFFGSINGWAQQTICGGSVHQYKVDENENNGEGTPGSVYNWEVLESGFIGNITNLTNSGNQIEIDWGGTPLGSYTLQVSETQPGCDLSSNRQLNVLIQNEVELNIPDQYICPEGGIAVLEAGFGFDIYTWYNSDGEIISENHNVTVEEPGTYYVETEQGGCFASDEVEALPMEFPLITVNTEQFNTLIVEYAGGNINIEFQLEDLNGNIVKSWQVNNVFNNVPQGIYIVRIRSWDATCSMYITASTISIPNAITPNSDGYNDIWDLTRLFDYAPNARIEVFDRYGKKLKVISAENGFIWDGKYLGKSLPPTSYLYIMYINGEKITGWLLIKN